MKKMFMLSILVTLLIGIWIGSNRYHETAISWAAGTDFERYRFDLAMALNVQGNVPAWFRQPFVAADFNIDAGTTRLQAWKRITRRFVTRCEKIGAGTPQEENTTRAVSHTCNHNLKTACTVEMDLTDN